MDSTDPRITRLLATLRFGKAVTTGCGARDIALMYSSEDARLIASLMESLGAPLYHEHPQGFRTRKMVEEKYNLKPHRKAPKKPEQTIFG